MRIAVVLGGLLLLPVLAGCLGASVDPTSASDLAPPLPTFRYLCPGERAEGSAAPCLAQLPQGDAMLQQPYVAIYEDDPDVMAVGVHLTHPPSGVTDPAGLVAVPVSGTQLVVYVTEDGGGAWRETFVPAPAMEVGPLDKVQQGDAALLFDAEGRMHLSAIARVARFGDTEDTNGVNSLRTFYVRSDDLGRTWNEPVWLGGDDVGHDRNFMVRDPGTGALYVVWQNSPRGTSQVAWSLDDGATWRAQTPEQRADCYYAGMPVILGDVLRFACIRDEQGSGPVLRIYAFDAATGDLTLLLDGVAEAQRPFFTLLADGVLVLHYDTCTGTTYPPTPPNPCALDSPILRSRDGGATWMPGGSALGLADGDWHRARIYWSAADPFGGQHLLVRYERDEPLPSAAVDPTARLSVPVVYEARHVVLDGSGAVFQSTVLESWRSEPARADEWVPDLEDEGRQSGHPRCAGNSCFNGFAWAGDRGLVAFAHDNVVRLALVTREGPPLGDFAQIEAAPVRAYVPPPGPTGLDEPVEYEFTGHVDVPHCYASEPAAVGDLGSDTFEFEVPAGTRFVNGSLDWETAGPDFLADLDVILYNAQGDAFDPPDGFPETFAFELREGDQGLWTALVRNCENPPTDFTLEILLS